MVSTAGINCKLNARVYVQMLHSPIRPLGPDICWWPGASCLRTLYCGPAGSPLEGRGGGGDMQTPATPLMSFPPPWVFLIIKISGLRTSGLSFGPHLGNTITGYTPKQLAPGLHQGVTGLGKVA